MIQSSGAMPSDDELDMGTCWATKKMLVPMAVKSGVYSSGLFELE
jgi:hypothetical protein